MRSKGLKLGGKCVGGGPSLINWIVYYSADIYNMHIAYNGKPKINNGVEQ